MDPYKERRRVAGAFVFVGALVLGGWVSASQSFVTLRSGQLVHPSPFGWLFGVCVALMVVGIYMWTSTYKEWLIPTKWRLVDHSLKYSLGFSKGTLQLGDTPTKGAVAVQLVIAMVNGGPSVIDVHLESMDVVVNGKSMSNTHFLTRDLRILPNQEKQYFSAPVLNVFLGLKGVRLVAEVDYTVTYGPPGGALAIGAATRSLLPRPPPFLANLPRSRVSTGI
jgi:hypothetical protein